nr:MAG TPA: hypothetical protein [Bacteriophage sp.]
MIIESFLRPPSHSKTFLTSILISVGRGLKK